MFSKGRYRARVAAGPDDLARAQALRARVFGLGAERDADHLDEVCRHMLVEEVAGGALAGCYRFLELPHGGLIGQSYSAQFYHLESLVEFPGPLIEMGRFCIAPGRRDPDILRVAWGAMTRLVDRRGIEMLFGCSSFAGTEPEVFAESFALLAQRHLAPARWRPGVRSARVVPFAEMFADRRFDPREAMRRMPSLLKTYLTMGGWVSDHAVIDSGMNTMHVFTGVEIAAIPPARQRLLRAVAQ
ncbi:GNAT family N-acetyltransferase [Roseovarius sp. SCSIO 43702]|uniref:GNAT family N-acetyltransferase n=1 Tax=Roseovarius sp. SCSIO 43702 TaxID=2823043 RepID=UPI001C72F35C|nr:GNAT family N-acetyltransferase [Roseovarius sp. SCSIO 43702]QYX55426.1 GNAT family N-acetyltransferase [Roseovarius sp. SCSIO 43702]